MDTDDKSKSKVIYDSNDMKEIGVIKVPIPLSLRNQSHSLANSLSEVTPLNAASEDGEYAFYRNIMEDPDFPYEIILEEGSEIARAIRHYFLGDDYVDIDEELERDDAFCISYNTTQDDSSCSKHKDPSDITVNICLEKSQDCKGSRVMFYGKQSLNDASSTDQYPLDEIGNIKNKEQNDDSVYIIEQTEGYATIHWGRHPHETEPLKQGVRTNIILTYKYKDESKSGIILRTCYM